MPQYLFSFVVGFVFGIFVDVHESRVALLPQTLPLRVLYFIVSYLCICFGVALSNRCIAWGMSMDRAQVLFCRVHHGKGDRPHGRLDGPEGAVHIHCFRKGQS